jgi:3-dehydroquinate synthase
MKSIRCDVLNSSVEKVDSLSDIKIDKNSIWVCDENSEKYVPCNVNKIVLPSGEVGKTYHSVGKIIEFAIKNNLGRDDYFIGVGGGVICDITAFSASIYMRGTNLILAPTTLLAMVDASLGGKTAIDLYDLKNLVGTFYPAQKIYLNFNSLKSLSDKEFHNGLGEILKHSLLSIEQTLYLFLIKNKDKILNRDTKILEEVVYLSLLVKKEFIENDPTENREIRQALNLGHTFAHGLEIVGKFNTFSHGEAVVWGMMRALEVGVALKITPLELAVKFGKLLKMYNYNVDYLIEDKETFFETIRHDKKKRSGETLFVLVKAQGEIVQKPLDQQTISDAIASQKFSLAAQISS